jgi:hypothetical protein
MSRKTRELEARVVELEQKLSDINRNMEYIASKIHKAVQIELDEAWQTSMENLKKQLGGKNVE